MRTEAGSIWFSRSARSRGVRSVKEKIQGLWLGSVVATEIVVPHVVSAPTVKRQGMQLVKRQPLLISTTMCATHTTSSEAEGEMFHGDIWCWLSSHATFAVFQEGVGMRQQQQLHHICLSLRHSPIPARLNCKRIPCCPAMLQNTHTCDRSCYACILRQISRVPLRFSGMSCMQSSALHWT